RMDAAAGYCRDGSTAGEKALFFGTFFSLKSTPCKQAAHALEKESTYKVLKIILDKGEYQKS
ncbi:MAG: hypothetical protein IJT73_02700, partial [Selenomonadaceae bacterium]|nr:hypothetical protein [Selenomonadaceae bacterium]